MFITQEDIQKKVNERIKEVLSGISINFDLHPGWYFSAKIALLRKTPIQLGMSAKDYGQIYHNLCEMEVLDCYTFAGMNNEIAECTAENLKMVNILDYIELQDMVETYAFKYNDQTEEARKKAQNAVMEEVIKRQQKPPINNLPN